MPRVRNNNRSDENDDDDDDDDDEIGQLLEQQDIKSSGKKIYRIS